MDHNSAQVTIDAWVARCQASFRTGAITPLDALLIDPPIETPLAAILFFQGCTAVLRGDYEQAAHRLYDAGADAGSGAFPWLRASIMVWHAYAHILMGHYAVARSLVAAIDSTSIDEHLRATLCFVEGLLASYCDHLGVSQDAFERARTLALRLNDQWLEARCCVNLASVYQHQGLMERATRMLRRATSLYQAEGLEDWRLIQVRNTAINILRLCGNLTEALAEALPLPEAGDPIGQHFRGWLALSTVLVAVDANDVGLAEHAWQRAAELLEPVRDNEFSNAELIWTRAWLRVRQRRLPEARQDIQVALRMIDDQMDTDSLHASAIAGIIALAHADLGSAGRLLHQTCARFRDIGYQVGIASLLVHMVRYYEHTHHNDEAHLALAEALTIMRFHGLYGLYYWDPDLMAALCLKAIQGDVWGGQAVAIARRLPASSAIAGADHALEQHPEDTWADFAATLGARRLAATHWLTFVPLLRDPRPAVRRRAAQILVAAQTPQAEAALQTLRHDPDPIIQQWVSQHHAVAITPPITIHSFGRFQILCHGEPLSVRRSGSRKALAMFGLLLLVGERGFESRDLGLLLWPQQSADGQRAALHSTISGLRQVLNEAVADQAEIISIARRYQLRFHSGSIWWDWQELCAMVQRGPNQDRRDPIDTRYTEIFMDGLFDLLTEPPNLDPRTRMRWEEIYERVHDLVEQHAAAAAQWVLELHSGR